MDPEEPTLKRKRNSKSRGGYRFPSGSAPPAGGIEKQASKLETDLEIMTWITTCGQCCGKVPEEASCCLLQQLKRGNTGEYRFQVSMLVNLNQIICFIFLSSDVRINIDRTVVTL